MTPRAGLPQEQAHGCAAAPAPVSGVPRSKMIAGSVACLAGRRP